MRGIVTSIGGARLTLGFERFDRLDLDRHRAMHGRVGFPSLAELTAMAEAVGLRGRGGAGFPFARKLQTVAQRSARLARTAGRLEVSVEDASRPVVVVNGAESEPGSLKDRVLLARAPHLVLDGALVAAAALGTDEIVLAVENDEAARSVRAAVSERRMSARVVRLPERFVAGQSGAVVRAINGQTPVPPGRRTRAAMNGVDGRPTLLSNAETFAQLAVLASLGPDLYATTGTAAEPGTTLLTVGGTTVVEVPFGTPLGAVLERCDTAAGQGVLVGGYHGSWLKPAAAATAVLSRAGMSEIGGMLGSGVVLPLTPGTCALGEVRRVAAYLAGQSAGQCGPCRLGLPDVVRALEDLLDGSGGAEGVLEAAAVGRGRGACTHPDGTARFVLSALDAFADEIEIHRRGGSCGMPVYGVLPLPLPSGQEARLSIDWTRCDGHGLCGQLLPALVRLDRYGFPVLLDADIPLWLEGEVQRAISLCPAKALRVAVGVAPAAGRRP